MGDELVGEEVTHHYEEQDGKDNDSACSQLEWGLEWCDVVGDPLAKGGFGRERDIKLAGALVGGCRGCYDDRRQKRLFVGKRKGKV